MSVGPFDIGQVVTRLRNQVTGLRAIGGAADFAAAVDRPGALPAAFVLLPPALGLAPTSRSSAW